MQKIVELLDGAAMEHQVEHGATDYELAFAIAMDLAKYSTTNAPDTAVAIDLANCFATWIEQIHQSQRDQALADKAVLRISDAFTSWLSKPQDLAEFADSLRSSIEYVEADWVWEGGGELRRSAQQGWMRVKPPRRKGKLYPRP